MGHVWKCGEKNVGKKGVSNKGSIERISSVEKHLFVILIKFLKKQWDWFKKKKYIKFNESLKIKFISFHRDKIVFNVRKKIYI